MEKQKKYQMTKEQYDEVVKKLDELDAMSRRAIQNNESLIKAIHDLTHVRDNVQIVECTDKTSCFVEIGDYVTYIYDGETEAMTSKLVTVDGNPHKGTVSVLSPLGGAIHKRRVGEEVSYQAVNGIEVVKILGIKKVNNELTAASQKTLR